MKKKTEERICWVKSKFDELFSNLFGSNNWRKYFFLRNVFQTRERRNLDFLVLHILIRSHYCHISFSESKIFGILKQKTKSVQPILKKRFFGIFVFCFVSSKILDLHLRNVFCIERVIVTAYNLVKMDFFNAEQKEKHFFKENNDLKGQ